MSISTSHEAKNEDEADNRDEVEFAMGRTVHSRDKEWRLTKNKNDAWWTLWWGEERFDDQIVSDYDYSYLVDSLNSIPILREEIIRLRELTKS